MRLRDKFRQFVNWLYTVKANDEFPLPDFQPTDTGSDTWTQGEVKAAGENVSVEGFIQYFDFLAGWLDSKTGSGPAPTKGVITDNPNVDGWVMTGVLAAVVLFVVRKLFV